MFGASEMKQLSSRCVILLAIGAILSACSADEKVPAGESTANKLELSLGDDEYKLPIELCQVAVRFVMVKGWQGESSAAMNFDGQTTNVSFQHHFEEGGIHYRDQWDSGSDAVHSTDGHTVTASGTIKNVARYRLEDGQSNEWVRLDESSSPGERPFELSATCTKT